MQRNQPPQSAREPPQRNEAGRGHSVPLLPRAHSDGKYTRHSWIPGWAGLGYSSCSGWSHAGLRGLCQVVGLYIPKASHHDSSSYMHSLPLTNKTMPDSWIEVASQPSSSSLSSVADEIITTGLRIHNDPNRRRRRVRQNHGHPIPTPSNNVSPNSGTSSQEEYEESDSDPDRIMTSSNEGLQTSPSHQEWPLASNQAMSFPSSGNLSSNDGDGDDSDENSTAINVPRGNPGTVFTPQPNAFTHPPSSQPSQPYFPSASARPAVRQSQHRHSYPSHYSQHPRPLSPSRTNHDEALRASLSTLLSCAAAARSLPKNTTAATGSSALSPAANRIEPSSLRMVTEEEAMGLPPSTASRPAAPRQSTQNSMPRSSSADKHKRKPNQRSNSKDRKKRRASSIPRIASVDEVSPTLLTWVVSAGVVVLVSAISFSAGYVMGRETGKAEAEAAGALARPSSCANEVGKGLRRFRWGSAATSVRA